MKLLFPLGYKCVCCGSEIDQTKYGLCDKCKNTFPAIAGKVCVKCGLPLYSDADYCVACKKEIPKFEKAFAPYRYEGNIRKLIHKFKYDGSKYIADSLSKLLYEYFVSLNIRVDVVVPVPLYLYREFERGFNQAEELCKYFVNNNFNVDMAGVAKVKNTQMQASLSLNERKENILDAFRVLTPNKFKGKVVLLVDDVYTSGSTFSELTKAILKTGASKVYCLSLARTCFD